MGVWRSVISSSQQGPVQDPVGKQFWCISGLKRLTSDGINYREIMREKLRIFLTGCAYAPRTLFGYATGGGGSGRISDAPSADNPHHATGQWTSTWQKWDRKSDNTECWCHVYVSGSTDDGFCQLSSTGSWVHTSRAQLPYGPSADHTNGTGTLTSLPHILES